MLEVVYELNRMWLQYLVLFNPVEPLERVVPASDDQKLVLLKHRNQYGGVCLNHTEADLRYFTHL